MKCPSCGADVSSDATSCGYCNSSVSAGALRNRAAILTRIKESKEYAKCNSPERLARLPKFGAFQKAFLVAFFAIFIGGSAFMCIVALGMAGVIGVFGGRFGGGSSATFSIAPLIFALFPLGFIVIGVFMFRAAKAKMTNFESAPAEAFAVVVVDKRTEVSGGSGDSSAHTNYFVTCETEDGSREEYQVWDGRTYGKMSTDDAGILFVRDKYGLDFDRVVL